MLLRCSLSGMLYNVDW